MSATPAVSQDMLPVCAVQEELRRNKFVKKFRLGVYGEGEDGVTIAEF